MSKYFKNYKSEGDGEYRSVDRSKVHPRSYSCKPDIGPSGDHNSLERPAVRPKRNFSVNMWLNNIGSGSSETSHSNNELYRLNEDHLEKINFIRRKLNMIELQDTQETKIADDNICNLDDNKTNNIAHTELKINNSNTLRHPPNDKSNTRAVDNSKIFPKNKASLSSMSSLNTSDSWYKYKPPLKRICLYKDGQFAVRKNQPISTNKTDCSETDIEQPCLNLDNEQISQRNKNKSIQCTSKDTELTESSSHSTHHHHGDMGDNIDLEDVETYVEPEIVLNQPIRTIETANTNCIKFLPIKEVETSTSSDKGKKDEFFDAIISNCSFSFGKFPRPFVPSHDSFFKSRKKQKKKRFKKRGKSMVEGVKLDKSSIEVQRTFLSTSDTSEIMAEREVHSTRAKKNTITFNNPLMTSLTIPSKRVEPFKLPLVMKLSEFIYRTNCGRSENVEMEKIVFEDDISSNKNGTSQCKSCVKAGSGCSNYREAADLISRRARKTDDIKENEVAHLHNNLGNQTSSNKCNTKKKQSVDYDFYSIDLPHGSICDVVQFSEEIEEDSDSECLTTIENCCCIKRLFRRRRRTFFSD